MSKTFKIAKGEFYRYFISPLAYVYLICFLLLNGSFALYFGGIFSSGNASLQPMFEFLPWIFLLFIPGIAMRLWAEEFKSGTILQTMTLPVSVNAWVWGKFLAAWAFCTLALLLTFPFIITVNILGSPDNPVILNSYFGAVLLAGAMLSISQTASSLSKSQVIALVIAVLINLLFFLSGLEYVLGFFRSFVPVYIVDMISSFSFLTHIANFNLGIFELRDLVFFISLILMFNAFTSLIVVFKTSGAVSWMKPASVSGGILAAVIVFCAFIGINLFANNTLRQIRADFTEEQLFTPGSSTLKVLQNLPAPVTAKVYYSPILGERDERMRLFFDKLRLLLQTYRDISDGRFDYRIYNPEPLSDIEDRALQAGLQALPVSDLNAAAYFGIVLVNENGYSRTIPFLPLSRQNLLEQDLTENIYLLEHRKKTLGLLTSLPMTETASGNIVSQSWQITEELQKYYKLKMIKSAADLQDIDLLMIAHPQKLSDDLEEAVYRYSVSGGKILAFFDIAAEALKLAGPITSLSSQSDYGSLPQKWGFRFYDRNVIADLDNASEVAIETADYSGTTQDLIQFYLTPENFTPGLPETLNLKRMLLTSASVFLPLKDAEIHFIPLIRASAQSQLLPAEVVTKSLHPTEILRRFKADRQSKVLAAHIIGKNKNAPFELIVVGDSDLLYDSFWTTSTMVGSQSYNVPLLDNGNFVLNALDTLAGENSLLALRGKSRLPRPFTALDRRQKQILRQFKIKEKDIFDQIGLIKRGLEEIWNKKDFEGRRNFTPDELSIISKVKNDLEQKRRDLFTIRSELNRNLEQTEAWVKFFDIYAVPGLIILAVLAVNFRKLSLRRPQRPRFNRRFLKLLLASAICLGLGFCSISFIPEKNIPEYEGRLLFPELSEQINNVSRIDISARDSRLLFIKKNDVWHLEGHPGLLVNQSRIRSFLTALLQAYIYEKKADKIENLPRFGLLPPDNPDGTAVSVSLKNNRGDNILAFDVGNYNVELGRGSLGAYTRFPGQFQIWLAAIELVDLKLDYRNWTYASLWNLQFGRFSSINGSRNADYIASIVSLLLNTPLTETNVKPSTKPVLQIVADGEYFKDLTINFYEQEQKFYIRFAFNKIINNPVLKTFANEMQQNFYEISVTDMEKIKHAVNTGTGQ